MESKIKKKKSCIGIFFPTSPIILCVHYNSTFIFRILIIYCYLSVRLAHQTLCSVSRGVSTAPACFTSHFCWRNVLVPTRPPLPPWHIHLDSTRSSSAVTVHRVLHGSGGCVAASQEAWGNCADVELWQWKQRSGNPKTLVAVEGIKREGNTVARLSQVRGLVISEGRVDVAAGQVITQLGFMCEGVRGLLFFVFFKFVNRTELPLTERY